MSIDAMKRALEALEHEAQRGNDDAYRQERDTLRAAIEQAQEPIAWVGPSWLHPETRTWVSESFAPEPIDGWIPLYTAPRQWQGLTEAEIDAVMPVADGSAETDAIPVEVSPGIWGKEYYEVDAWSRPLVIELTRAIESKLKEKNNG